MTEYQIVKDVIPTTIEPGAILNIMTREVTTYTHGFHKYPAKFIPHIPRWAIQKYLPGLTGQTILDPFCGSGTVLVESMLAGHHAIGLDIDPLSALISKVKTTRLDPPTLKNMARWLIEELQTAKDGEFMPECATLEHWFTPEAIKKLSLIRTLVNRIPERFGDAPMVKDIQDLLLICFSSIIRRVSNADDESQKAYVSHTKIKVPAEVNGLFLTQLNLFVERAVQFTQAVKPELTSQVICASSTNGLTERLAGHAIALAITSPPYIKAIDYIYNQMVELFWIGDLFDMQTQAKQNSKKKAYIGNKAIPKVEFADYTPYNKGLGLASLDQKLQQVYDSDPKNGHMHAYVTFNYFRAMEQHFVAMANCLSAGTPYVMVVGDSSVSDIYFETADILIALAARHGFENVNKWGYKIKNRFMRFDRKGRGGIIKIDWVFDFINSPYAVDNLTKSPRWLRICNP